jgi:RNA polymerase sigma-70 factor (ECF subfamily)
MMTEVDPALATSAEPRADAAANERRIRRIVDESYEFLWRSLRRLGVAEDNVADAAQQVLVVLARRVDTVSEGSERAFLFGVAIRVAADARRSTRRRHEDGTGASVESVPDSAPSPEDIAESRALRRLLDRALDELPIEQRTVFVLYELEELTAAEVAVMLEIAPGTVASRLRRARALFQEAFERVRAEPIARAERVGGR